MSIEKTCRLCGEEFDTRRGKCPLCGDDGTTDNEPINFEFLTTETLEEKLKKLSVGIADGPLKFQKTHEERQQHFLKVSGELKRRREVSDEQPTPLTMEQTRDNQQALGVRFHDNLVLKITEMEAEQARLVVEAGTFKAARDEAEARLALVIKHTKREPLSRDDAQLLALRHKYKKGTAVGSVDDWVIDAIVESSK
jgi:hypothetical protein